MLRIILILTVLFFPAFYTIAEAGSGPGSSTASDILDQANATEEIYHKIKANRAFLKAARKIVEESGKPGIESYIKMAESLSAETELHLKDGQMKLAHEDIADSTRLAILAITLSKVDDVSIRDYVIKEELALKEIRDKARKEAMINKSINEVETFIGTAEKLLDEDGIAMGKDSPARIDLDGAKKALSDSREHLRQGAVDDSLEDINNAYRLATRSVREIKQSKAEIITFPKPDAQDEKEIYAYELKKNETYVFFASQVVKDEGGPATKLVKESSVLLNDALKEKNKGDLSSATVKLRKSTALLIKAIKLSFGEVN